MFGSDYTATHRRERASPAHSSTALDRLSLKHRAPASGTCGSAPLALHRATQSTVMFSAQRTLDLDRTDNHHPSGSQNTPKKTNERKKHIVPDILRHIFTGTCCVYILWNFFISYCGGRYFPWNHSCYYRVYRMFHIGSNIRDNLQVYSEHKLQLF